MVTVLVQAPECVVCHKSDEVELPKAAYEAWRGGVHVQDAFPDMTPDDRELLISGTHPACWKFLYGE